MSIGSHPIPSRTRKLSLSEPMVLQGKPCGRVGRCRNYESLAWRQAGLSSFSALTIAVAIEARYYATGGSTSSVQRGSPLCSQTLPDHSSQVPLRTRFSSFSGQPPFSRPNVLSRTDTPPLQ